MYNLTNKNHPTRMAAILGESVELCVLQSYWCKSILTDATGLVLVLQCSNWSYNVATGVHWTTVQDY